MRILFLLDITSYHPFKCGERFAMTTIYNGLARIPFTNLLSLYIRSFPIVMNSETIKSCIDFAWCKKTSECLDDSLMIVKPIIMKFY